MDLLQKERILLSFGATGKSWEETDKLGFFLYGNDTLVNVTNVDIQSYFFLLALENCGDECEFFSWLQI